MSCVFLALFCFWRGSTEPRKWVARAEMDLGEASRSSSSKPKVACADTESVLRTYVALLSESLGRECTQQLRHQGAPRPLDALLPEGMDKVLVSAAAASGDGAGAGNSLSLRRSGFFFPKCDICRRRAAADGAGGCLPRATRDFPNMRLDEFGSARGVRLVLQWVGQGIGRRPDAKVAGCLG